MNGIKMIYQLLMTLFLALSSLYSTEDMQRDAGSEEWHYPISIGTKLLMNLGQMLPLDQQGAEIYQSLRSFNHFINRILTKEESCQQQELQQELDSIISTLGRIHTERFFSQEIQEVATMLISDFRVMRESLATKRDIEEFIVEALPKIAVKEFLTRYKGTEEKSTRCNECHRGYFKQRSGSRGKIECLLCNHQQILSQAVVAVPTKIPVRQITGSFDGLKGNAAFQSFTSDIRKATVVFAGHSLGAPLAEMLGTALERKIDVERFKTVLIQSQSVTDQVKGKDIVFIVGNTGAGKSTTITYLLGNKLRKKRGDFGSYLIEPDEDTAGPKIGHGAFSATILPSLYTLDESSTICDCPGFSDTRGEESEFFTAMIMQMIASHAHSIRFTAIIRDTELLWGRGSLFTNLLSMLNSIFKTDTFNPPIMFVVNKTSSHQREGGILEKFQANIRELSHSFSQEREMFCHRFNLEHYMEIVNVLDDGESRGKLLQDLQVLPPIEKHAINFFGNPRMNFLLKDVVRGITSEITTTLQHKMNLLLRLKYYEKTLEEIAIQTSRIEKEMENFKLQATSIPCSPQALKPTKFSQQEEMRRLLQKKEEEKCFLEREIFELQQMREEMINDSRECPLWREDFSDVLGRTSKTFRYPLKAPFTHVEEKSERSGYFIRQLFSPAEGIYQATYVSDFQLGDPLFWGSGSVVDGILWGASAGNLSNRASVTIYGKHNQQPEIKQKIQQIEGVQQQKRCQHDILINDISALSRGLEEVIKRQAINQQEEVIRQQENVIGNLQKQKTFLENSYQLTKEIFNENQSLYGQQEILSEILVSLADQADREVIGASYLMLQELKMMQQSLEERNSLSSTFIEPKQTRCGHLFNCPEITEWLMQNQFCPVCRTPTTLEELTSVSLSLF